MARGHDAPRTLSLPTAALDHLLEGCQIIGFDYTYLYINQLAAAQGRSTVDRLVGRTMMACFPGIEQTEVFARLRRCLTERTSEEMDNEFEFGDGARIVFALKLIPIPEGACILSLDVTERRHRASAIVADSDDAIVGRRLDGIITSWNHGAERVFGYAAQEMIGQHYYRLFPASQRAMADAATERLAHGEHVPPFEAVRHHKDGRRIDVSMTLSPYRDAAGQVIGVSMIARDITALKQIQRDLATAKDTADATNRELEAFAYSVAHDLRAPLRHIDGFATALIEDHAAALDDHARGYLQRIRRSSALMARLIDDLLKLSQASRQDLARQRIDISALAHKIIAQLRVDDPARRVEVAIEPGLAATGDPALVAVVLGNLLGNAWKFTARQAEARIAVDHVVRDDRRCLRVRDNGVGFAMRDADRLFTPFHRLHADDGFEGTGIGLATVHRIIERHGGQIWADGEVGAGATFTFTLQSGRSDPDIA